MNKLLKIDYKNNFKGIVLEREEEGNYLNNTIFRIIVYIKTLENTYSWIELYVMKLFFKRTKKQEFFL